LLAILLGPWSALLAISLCLTVQALLFGDGGILSLAANTFTMGFVAPFVGYGIYRAIAQGHEGIRRLVGAAAGGYLGIVTASLAAGIILGLQPTLAHDSLGHAIYFPFGLAVSVPAMLGAHLLVAGPVEALVTAGALAYLVRSFPELSKPTSRSRTGSGYRLGLGVAALLLLSPLGLIASGSAWGEWEIDQISKMVGYAPTGLATRTQTIQPLLPDYGFHGSGGLLWQVGGYLVSALLGSVVVGLVVRALFRPKPTQTMPRHISGTQGAVPSWMLAPNHPLPEPAAACGKNRLESTALNIREKVARAVAIEEVARRDGFLQRMSPAVKLVGALTLLVAVELTRDASVLLIILSSALLCAAASRISLQSVLATVGGSTMFFGLPLVVPMTLRVVNPGPVAVALGPVVFTTTGLGSGLLMGLRLASGLAVSYLLVRTSKSSELLRILRRLGLPAPIVQWLGLTYRYLFVLTETLGEMIEARRSRQPGRPSDNIAREYVGAGTAVLFGKSMSLVEELHLAMKSRSFDAPRPVVERQPWPLVNGAYLAIGIALFGFVLLRSIHAV
jgi:cobalt/nickel transport system permease protein